MRWKSQRIAELEQTVASLQRRLHELEDTTHRAMHMPVDPGLGVRTSEMRRAPIRFVVLDILNHLGLRIVPHAGTDPHYTVEKIS